MAIEQERVALVTGAAFGCPEHVRLTFATSMEQIEKGLERLGRLLGA
jgi:aspartate aminotransferase